MVINKENKTITFGTFELIAAVNYIERCVTTKDRTTWKLVPEVTVKKRLIERVKKAGR